MLSIFSLLLEALMASRSIEAAKRKLSTAIDTKVSAEIYLSEAADDVLDAKDNLSSAFKAGARLANIITVVNTLYGGTIHDHDVATIFLDPLVSAIIWANRGTKWSVKATVNFAAGILPCLDIKTIRASAFNSRPWTNMDVARRLGISLETRERLNLTMIGACDLTDEEFKTWKSVNNRNKDRERQATKRRAEGKPTSDERKADNAAKKAYLETLSIEKGKSVATVRRYIKEGKLPEYMSCKSDVRTIYNYTTNTDATFASAQAASAHQTCSKPSVVSNIMITAYAAVAPRAAASPLHKKNPAVSDRGLKIQNSNNAVYNTLRIVAVAAASAPISFERVLQNAASACEQYVAVTKGGRQMDKLPPDSIDPGDSDLVCAKDPAAIAGVSLHVVYEN